MGVVITNTKNEKHSGFYTGMENAFFTAFNSIAFDNDNMVNSLKAEETIIFNKEQITFIMERLDRWIGLQLLIRDENPMFNYFPKVIFDKEVQLAVMFSKTDKLIDILYSLRNYLADTIANNGQLYVYNEER